VGKTCAGAWESNGSEKGSFQDAKKIQEHGCKRKKGDTHPGKQERTKKKHRRHTGVLREVKQIGEKRALYLKEWEKNTCRQKENNKTTKK